MLVIRLQRQGRSGHAHFRVVVQDSRWSPKRGKVVAHLGSYDPHTKAVILDKEKAALYLKNGAQPSERIVVLFENEGLKLPSWAAKPAKKEGKTRNPEKLRKNQPKEEKLAVAEEASDEKPEDAEAATPEQTSTEPAETKAEQQPETAEKPEEDEAAKA